MAVSTLLDQARAGHAEAIALLINRQFQAHGMTVQVVRDGSCLRLRLEGNTLLTQQKFAAYVRQALARLGCPAIHRVEIAAVKRGQLQPLWRTSFILNEAERSEAKRLKAKQLEARRFEADVAAISPGSPSDWDMEQEGPDPTDLVETVPKHRPLPSRKVIALQWFIASLVGMLATLGITAAISALLVPVVASITGMEQLSGFAIAILLAMQLMIGIPIAGLTVGYAQTCILRRYLRTVGGWLLITPLGCLIGFFIAVIIHFAGNSALNLAGWANSLGQAEGTTGQLLSLGITTAGVSFGFGFLGLAQFAILSGRMRRAQGWIGVTGLSGTVAWLVGIGLFKLMLPSLDNLARIVNMTPMLLSLVLAAASAWFIFQGLSSVYFAVLLRPQNPRP